MEDGVGGMEVGGACPRSISACMSCCKVSLESVGLVLDTGADHALGAQLLHKVWVLTSCRRN